MGTHPIFESDFDCLTEKSNEMVTKSKSKGNKGSGANNQQKSKNKKKKKSASSSVVGEKSTLLQAEEKSVLTEVQQNGSEINGNNIQEEKKVVEEKVPEPEAVENVEQVDDNDGWEVPKTKKGKGPKKTEPVKVEKNNGKKNTREAPREQPKKKEIEKEEKPEEVESEVT